MEWAAGKRTCEVRVDDGNACGKDDGHVEEDYEDGVGGDGDCIDAQCQIVTGLVADCASKLRNLYQPGMQHMCH